MAANSNEISQNSTEKLQQVSQFNFEDPNTDLVFALINFDIETLRKLKKAGHDISCTIDSTTKRKTSSLFYVFEIWKFRFVERNLLLEVIKFLLDNGADVNFKQEKNNANPIFMDLFLTPMLLSTSSLKAIEESESISEINQANPAINSANEHNKNSSNATIKHSVAFSYILETTIAILELIMEYKPDLNFVKPPFGDTPLSSAIQIGSYKIVKLLLENGASIEKYCKAYNREFYSANHFLQAPAMSTNIASLLVENGLFNYIDRTQLNSMSLFFVQLENPHLYPLLIEYFEKNHYFDSTTFLPHFSCLDMQDIYKASEDLVRLLNVGCPCDSKDKEKGEILKLALSQLGLRSQNIQTRRKNSLENIAIDDFNNLSDPRIRFLAKAQMLFKAIQKNKLTKELLEKLLRDFEVSYKLKLSIRTKKGYNTPLHLACRTSIEMTNLLLEKIATYPKAEQYRLLSARNRHGLTAFDIASQKYSNKELTLFINMIQSFVNESVLMNKALNPLRYVFPQHKIDELPEDVIAKVYQMCHGPQFSTFSDRFNIMEAAFLKANSSDTIQAQAMTLQNKMSSKLKQDCISSSLPFMSDKIIHLIMEYEGSHEELEPKKYRTALKL